MNKYIHSVRLAGLLLLWGCLMAGCSDSSDTEVHKGSLLQVCSMTRASSNGLPVPVGTQIALYPLPEDGSQGQGGLVTYAGKGSGDNDIWNSGVYVESDHSYYVYGYMPSALVNSYSISAQQSGSSITGASLKLTGLSVLSREDFCVVIGVKDATTSEEAATVTPGSFYYTAETDNETGSIKGISLLMDHLYAKATFRVKINSDYNQLRTIKVRSMKIVCTNMTMRGKIDAQINFVNGQSDPVNSIVLEQKADYDAAELTIFEDDEGKELKEVFDGVDDISVPAYFISSYANVLSLVSTYDVYDKSGNLIRQGCEAKNTLDKSLQGMKRGQQKTVNMTVNPTYLYVLSDPDLDNPTIEVKSE